MTTLDYVALDRDLRESLGLGIRPIAITFAKGPPGGIEAYSAAYPAPTSDGRTGAVPAGCVFWIEAIDRTFATAPEDHGNCSVGCVTHGLKSLEEVAGNADIAAVCEAGWVTPEAMGNIAAVRTRPGAVVYGPLADTPVDPTLVLLRLNGKQAMMLHDAWPAIRLEGKPQCHIVALAAARGEVALSVGCMLNRVRTGMSNNEMTCAVPTARLAELVGNLKRARAADDKVAAYAAADAARFAP